MDGNTTSNEEDEFIDALKDEMPEVFKNIDFNFDQLDDIDVLLQDVIKTKDIEKMQQLKKEVDDATNKIEQSEGLVLKLENEIIECTKFDLFGDDEDFEDAVAAAGTALLTIVLLAIIIPVVICICIGVCCCACNKTCCFAPK